MVRSIRRQGFLWLNERPGFGLPMMFFSARLGPAYHPRVNRICTAARRPGLGTGAQGTAEPSATAAAATYYPFGQRGITQFEPKAEAGSAEVEFRKDEERYRRTARSRQSLQKDLDGSNQNVLSLKVLDKAEKIEKLAKKIKNSARGY